MKRKYISIDNLVLSCNNPRLMPSFEEHEAIANMVADQKHKLLELATDIIQYGLNPLDTIGVYPSENYHGYFEVGEGNRRLCAIKLLMDPDLLKELDQSLYQKFKTLSKSYNCAPNIEVGVFKNEDELIHWMEIRHMGEQGGKGISKWDSVQKSRFRKRQTGTDVLLEFWEWMIDRGVLEKDEIFSVTKTNWQRILREKYFPFLKIQFENKYLIRESDFFVFSERIRAVQRNLQGKTVAIVYDQAKIEEFFDMISIQLYGKPYQDIIQDESEQIKVNYSERNDEVELTKDSFLDCTSESVTNTNTNDLNDILRKPSNVNRTSCNKDLFIDCDTIIPMKLNLESSNMRLNKIVNELKRLNPDDFPNACGVLLRALFELSSKVFLEKETGQEQTENGFQSVIKRTANMLLKQNRITKDQHASILNDVDSLRLIFNGYMHNTDGYPNGMALKNFFKSHKVFIEECLK